MSLTDLSLQDLCDKARQAGACDIVDGILKEYSSVQDLLERAPAEDASYWAYWYAIGIIKGRWPEAEPVLMRDPCWAYMYACDVLRGRWPEAEPVIMQDPEWTYHYACYVVGGRWPEAEPVIMTDPFLAYWYARHVIKGDWPEAGIVLR